MKIIAENRGAKCLSDFYVNNTTNLEWECEKGHKWEATPKNIKKGKWCPHCAGNAKYSIEDMRLIAQKNGGKCLSDKYVNVQQKLRWECGKGHQWEAIPDSINRGTWCPECGKEKSAKSRRLSIEEMHEIAEQRGGKCLSSEYINARTKLIWECSEGHQWKSIPDNIKRGSWCPKCSRITLAESKKLSMKEMIDLAKQRNGKCLSEIYANANQKLLWECSEGHQWESIPNSIKRGSWCPVCSGREKGTIEKMKQIAEERGGKCLSDEYVDGKNKLWWECSEGHHWQAFPSKIKMGRWCPKCAGTVKGTIEEMQRIAKERGGKCLAEEYVNGKEKLLWECYEGHQWESSPGVIKSGTWCPICSSGVGERICREFFEQIFEKKFPKQYPKWLINKNGNQMELDGYNEELRIAFEHHGEQHYTTNTYYIKTEKELQQRQRDDRIKAELCLKHNILLIEIPEVPTRTSINNIKKIIKKNCTKNNVPLPPDFDAKKVDLKNAYATSDKRKALEEIKQFAEEKNGKCISEQYINHNTKLLWECEKRHRWEAVPSSVRNGSWCPKCAGTVKLTIEDMHKIAKERGGKCLSEKYVNNNQKLLWECSKGHQWETTPHNIKKGTWCSKCAGTEKLSIEEMHRIAKNRGGKCLSDKYLSSKEKLFWECSEGHQWWAAPSKIKTGQWCPECGGTAKGNIEQMHRIAEEHGGKCLSDEYINLKTKLLWKCAEGHEWEAIPNNIKRGIWCPKCGIEKRSKSRRLTIEEMHQIAEQRGGRCLSSEYLNNSTKLLWECPKGHKWEAAPSKIKSKQWCPVCRKRKK